ncbi:hypothetical protein [Phreatobacter sp.]|nr:hypothetical protein [Phreatobacter sp.]
MTADLYLALVLFVFVAFGSVLAWVDFSGRHLRPKPGLPKKD